MTRYYGEFDFRVSGPGTDDEFEAHLDEVLEFLYADERVVDPDYTASLKQRTVGFSLSVETPDDCDPLEIFSGALRAAIHAADGATPSWEAHFYKSEITKSEGELLDA